MASLYQHKDLKDPLPPPHTENPFSEENAKYIDFGSESYTQYTARLNSQIRQHRHFRKTSRTRRPRPSTGRRLLWRFALDDRLEAIAKSENEAASFVIDLWNLVDRLTEPSAGHRYVDLVTLATIQQMVQMRENKALAKPLDMAEMLVSLWHNVIFDMDFALASLDLVKNFNHAFGVEPGC